MNCASRAIALTVDLASAPTSSCCTELLDLYAQHFLRGDRFLILAGVFCSFCPAYLYCEVLRAMLDQLFLRFLALVTKYFLLYLEPPELFLAIFLSQEHFALLFGYLGGYLYMLGLGVKHLFQAHIFR